MYEVTQRIKVLVYYNARQDLILEVGQCNEKLNELCIEHGHTNITPLLASMLVESRTAVDLLLESGYDVHREDLSRYPTDEKFKRLVDVVVDQPVPELSKTTLSRPSHP
jgi:hypothetical protein